MTIAGKMIGELRICPCCGGPVQERVHVDLNTNTMQIGDGVHKLEPKCAEMMKVLVDRYPATVGYVDLAIGMYGTADGEDHTASVKVYASRLRTYLDQHGVTLQPVRGRGYRLCPITPYTEALVAKDKTTPPSERVAVKPLPPPMNVEKEFLFDIFVRTCREYISVRETSPDDTMIRRAFVRLKMALGFVEDHAAK